MFRRLGFRRDHVPQGYSPASVQVFSSIRPGVDENYPHTKEDTAAYTELEQYPLALAYLSHIGVSLTDLQAIYPEFDDYREDEFDTQGHAFKYFDGSVQRGRLDRVIFPSENYPFILGVDRQEQYSPQSRNMGVGIAIQPRRRIRLDVYPDETVILKLQTATPADLVDLSTFIIDASGKAVIGDSAVANSRQLNPQKQKYHQTPLQPLSTHTNPATRDTIEFMSRSHLENGWNLSLSDIKIPSAELTRRIITSPISAGLDLKTYISE